MLSTHTKGGWQGARGQGGKGQGAACVCVSVCVSVSVAVSACLSCKLLAAIAEQRLWLWHLSQAITGH